MKRLKLLFFISILLLVSGCGYTTHSLLPSNFNNILIENFKNDIKITAEQSDQRMYIGYRPGMEIDLTRAVKDAYLQDGNLKIARESNADVILTGSLIDFKRDALRYDANNNVDEYRIKLVVNIGLENAKTGALVWKEDGFAGETTYRTSGSLAKSETAAIKDAISDLARRIVERTVEAW